MSSFSFPPLPSFRLDASLEDAASLTDFRRSFQNGSYLVALCTQGNENTRLLIHNRMYIPRTGDVILVPPYLYQHFVRVEGGYRQFRLTFPPEIAEVLCPGAVFAAQNGRYVFHLNSAEKYYPILKAAEHSFSLTKCLSLLIEIEESSKNKDGFKESEPLPLLLQKSLSYLLCHPAEHVSSAFLAARYEVSNKTIESLFRRHLGVTVGRLAEHLRYAKATELLSCGLPLTSVLATVGLKDKRALTALLKKYSPTDQA